MRLTAEQIERKVERATDRIDARFMNGALTQEQYDAEMKALDKWADDQYAKLDCPEVYGYVSNDLPMD